MSSLRDLCCRSPAVVLDAASATVQVGIVHARRDAQWRVSNEESGVAVFQCLQQLGVTPHDVSCWVYCEGPGSILGIRTVAMALRTWLLLRPAPVYAYCSLALVAHALGRDSLGIIADARRSTWHHYGRLTGLRQLATPELSGDLVMPEGFRHWTTIPPGVTTVPYSLEELLPCAWDADLLHLRGAPDAYLHQEPSYATWTPRIHRPPAS